MLGLISKLQRKPERARKRIALICSALITGIIVLFWAVNLSLVESDTVVSSQTDVGPLDALTKEMTAFMHDAALVFQGGVETFSGNASKTNPPATTAEAASN